jgi:uncharacterized protein (TIGR02594 family)
MRFRFQIAVAIGCAGLVALSLPAFGSPAAHNGAKARHAHRVVHVLPKPRPRHARTHNVIYRAPSYVRRLVEASRPVLGWPALVREARKYLGTNPTARKRLWCATFMNLILGKLGYSGTHSDAARSFAYYGKRISKPEVGAIAVLTRGKRGGHVGVVTGVDPHGNPILISGNHNKRVGEGLYPRSRVIAYVMPTRRKALARQARRGHARHSRRARWAPDRPLDSPIDELIAAIDANHARAEARAPHRSAQRMRRQAQMPTRVVRQMPD